MKTLQVLDNLKFHDENPYAEPVWVDDQGRVLRFMLRPGQVIREHNAPSSPFYVVVLQGRGIFTGGNGEEQTVGPNSLVAFAPGENHAVRALDEPLVFVGVLHGVPGKLYGRDE